jgi:hypothetical protein
MILIKSHHLLVLFAFTNVVTLVFGELETPKYCQIRSTKYSFEYLMNSNQSLFIHSLDRIQDMNRIFWWIIPVFKQQNSTSINSNNLYYIQNYANNEYICATNKFQKLILTRFKHLDTTKRLLHTIGGKQFKPNSKKCQWKFEKITNMMSTNFELVIGSKHKFKNAKITSPQFTITNAAFNQKLHAESSMINSFQRRVNLIFNSNELSENNGLSWIIDCEFPN